MKNIEFNLWWQRHVCSPQQRVTVGKKGSWGGCIARTKQVLLYKQSKDKAAKSYTLVPQTHR